MGVTVRNSASLNFAVGFFSVTTGMVRADIVYRDIPDIQLNSADGPDLVLFDVNLDNVSDLRFLASSDCPAGCGIVINPLNGGMVALGPVMELNTRFAERLDAGATVGPGLDYVSTFARLAQNFGGPVSTPWNTIDEPGFTPFTLQLNGSTHFGWLRVHVGTPPLAYPRATIMDLAFETTANLPIIAGSVPSPSTLFMTLLCSAATLRRRR
jgi:hypothetical protein